MELNNPKRNNSKNSQSSKNFYKRNNSVEFNSRNRNYTVNVINNEINNNTNMFSTIKESSKTILINRDRYNWTQYNSDNE